MRWIVFLAAASAMAQSGARVLPNSPEDLARGKKLYDGSCLFCHGPRGDGGKGANLAVARLPRAASDADLVTLITVGIPGTEMPGAPHMVEREITQVAAYVRTFAKVDQTPVPGDAAKGRAVYQAKGCQGCHTVARDGVREGGLMGPDLSNIGARRSAAYLREAMVDPGATLPAGYMEIRAKRKDGQAVSGLRVAETAYRVYLRDKAGKIHAHDRSDLTELVRDRKTSWMPGYGDKLTGDELTNLIAYLASLKEPN